MKIERRLRTLEERIPHLNSDEQRALATLERVLGIPRAVVTALADWELATLTEAAIKAIAASIRARGSTVEAFAQAGPTTLTDATLSRIRERVEMSRPSSAAGR